MTSSASAQGMSLHDAARAAGVTFAQDALPQDRYVTANGLRFHYLEWGDPSSPDVLLLHGFAQTCHSWDFVALSLCDRFHVVALDQRGHGDSDWAPDGDYTPDTQQEDLHAITQAIGLSNFVLMGLSMGGRNSLTYAANHPEEIRALVIVDSAPETESPGTTRIRSFASQNDELDSVDAFVERVMAYNHRRDPQQVRGSIMHNLKQLPNGKWTWKYDKRLRTRDRNIGRDPESVRRLWGYVESLSCPTLVVRGGESDVVAEGTASTMHERMPNGSLATVPGAGHLVPGDNPAGFEQAVMAFLGELG